PEREEHERDCDGGQVNMLECHIAHGVESFVGSYSNRSSWRALSCCVAERPLVSARLLYNAGNGKTQTDLRVKGLSLQAGWSEWSSGRMTRIALCVQPLIFRPVILMWARRWPGYEPTAQTWGRWWPLSVWCGILANGLTYRGCIWSITRA